ncbi:hypothetical protein HIM_12193 [Hirsutella minnesotensis 3608]|uniref:Piwi domain-containing protein n=1 Tax=Hirsutella minnesotensis 3608 TaxID=1043627 RepID=A0A0F7ZF28_9HYPO|nr:hypothetical protein HIM_12193 [Hirsutella minnesotensis 3608]
MSDASDDSIPKHPDVVDALNVIFGHGPRSKLHAISAVGSARFFPFGEGESVTNLDQDFHCERLVWSFFNKQMPWYCLSKAKGKETEARGHASSRDLYPNGPGKTGSTISGPARDIHQLIAARGFCQSARLGTGRLLLNANVTHGVFRASGRLSDLFDKFQIQPTQAFNAQAVRKLKAFAKFLPKTRVWVDMILSNGTEVRRTKAIHGLVSQSELSRQRPIDGKPLKFIGNFEYPGPRQVQFWLDDGKSTGRYITVFDYFKMKYKRTLQDYPLANLGRSDKPTLVPAEVIEIQPGQPVKARLTTNETTAMLDMACCSPYSNALSISTHGRKTLGLDEPALNRFGVSIDKSLLTVQGRVLNAPMVSYLGKDQRRTDVGPVNGSWNMRGIRVVKPGVMIERWTYLNIMKRSDSPIIDVSTMKGFARFLVSTGIKIKETPVMPAEGQMFTSWERAMRDGLEKKINWAKKNSITYIIFVLTERDSQGLYSKIKSLGDCTYGIRSTVVTSKHLLKPNNFMYYRYANVGLKINLKTGGVNHKLREDIGLVKDGKTMIAGYDVTHPTNMPAAAVGTRGAPSLVGLVASIDQDLSQWPAISWEQPAKEEMLSTQLVDAFKTRLELWQRHNRGQFPENIVIFRDGVSESQFAKVLEQELPSIREACRLKYPAKSGVPKLTIVVSVKRHHTRFFPTSPDSMSDSGNVKNGTVVDREWHGRGPRCDSGNVKNGTVVDRGVTQARFWDFFLTAHHALKGTARPAHYTVILDEIFRAKFKANAANELERLTHELCYLYGRATKAVSLCPPAYYADIVCERARAHRPEIFDISDTESVSSGTGKSVIAGRQVHENLKDTMYYI